MGILNFINSFLKEINHYKFEKINKCYPKHLSNNELFILIINIIIIIGLNSPIYSIEIKHNKRKLCLNSEIIMKIKDSNNKEIINANFSYKPDKVYVNGEIYIYFNRWEQS